MPITWKILAKEVLEARRDRNLLVHLVVVPVFLYPLLGFGAWQVSLIVQGASEGRRDVVWIDPSTPSVLRDSLAAREDLQLVNAPRQMLEAVSTGDLEYLRAARSRADSLRLDAVLAHHRTPEGESLEIAYDSSRDRSRAALQEVEELSEGYLEERRRSQAAELGLSEIDLHPLRFEVENTADETQLARFVLSLLLPMLLVLMLPQGAYYATLDTVVGERERGTFETLLSSPVTRGQILTGKFLYVVLSSMLSFVLNLVSLSIFLGFALQLMGLEGSTGFSMRPADLTLVLLAALLVAGFLAAAMMVVAVPCKNYREGQSALMPLFLIPALSGLVVATQGDTLSTWLALIPVVNVAALVREGLRSQMDWTMAAWSLGSLALLTTLALRLASRVGRREDIFFDPDITLRRLFRRERRRTA